MRETNTEKTTKEPVMISTGYAEGDMLGNILIWIERKNRPSPHRPHRRVMKMSGISKLRVAVKRSWRYSNELTRSCLRKLINIGGAGYNKVAGWISKLRRNGVND